MLVYQAAEAFTHWTGEIAPVAEMRRAAEALPGAICTPTSKFRVPLRSRHPVCDASSRRPDRKSSNFGSSLPMETRPSPSRRSSWLFRAPSKPCPSRRLCGCWPRPRRPASCGDRWPGQAASGSTVGRSSPARPAAPPPDGAPEVVFELLRFKEGDFVFDADSLASDGGAPVDVEPTLDAAEAMLDEWKSIEAVVPSLSGWVSLSDELPSDEVTLDRDRWAEIVAIGGGITVGGLGDTLQLGELPVSRTVKELVEQGLVTLGEAPAGGSAAPAAPPTRHPRSSPRRSRPSSPSSSRPPTSTTSPSRPSPSRAGSAAADRGRAREPRRRQLVSSDRFDPEALVIEPRASASRRSSPGRRSGRRPGRCGRDRPPAGQPQPQGRQGRRAARPPPRRSARPPWPRSTTTRSRSTAASS